jgi:uncharacterized protein YjbI with pentapeptide repeats
MATTSVKNRPGKAWTLRVRRRPFHTTALTVGTVLMVVALTDGVRWSALGHGVTQVSWAGWCAIVGSVLIGGVGARVASTRLRTRSWIDRRWAWNGLAIVAPLMALLGITLLLLFASVDTSQASVRIDVIKTALSVGAGGAALAALLLASRKQWSTERSEIDIRHDAVERRITELYTKAADQLGSDKAPVRLAGLYALERLAQDNGHQRQTIVNLLCAYLRMPYQLPDEEADPNVVANHRERVQEREVRLTAQRLLTEHLQPGDKDDPTVTFWADIDLDLTGATLIDFNLQNCTVHDANFTSSKFIGDTNFESTNFAGAAKFHKATFAGGANFLSATFGEVADFFLAHLMDDADFNHTTFASYADFNSATFARSTNFNSATFTKAADFMEATFPGHAFFIAATFANDAIFESTKFVGNASHPLDSNAFYTTFKDASFKKGVPEEVKQFMRSTPTSADPRPKPVGDDRPVAGR